MSNFDIVSNSGVSFDPKDRLIHAENIVKVYPGREGDKRVLDNVDLKIKSGEFVALVGPSGCGKSTLLRLILGAEEPTSGTLYFNGLPVGYPDPSRGIVYQKYSLFPNRTVLQNIVYGKKLSMSWLQWMKERKRIYAQAMEYLETAHLKEEWSKYPHELSGGQQQRASVLQALMMSPKALFMDEPFGALDPGTRARMQAFLLELWEKTGKTIIFVTHDLEEAVFLATRVVVLSQYYTDGRGEGDHVQRGARIVCDIPVGIPGEKAGSSKAKEDPAFTQTIERVRSKVLKPSHAFHLHEFDLKHDDSFHTPGDGEWTQQ